MKKAFSILIACFVVSVLQAQISSDIPVAHRSEATVEKDSDEGSIYSISPNPSSNFIKVKSKGAPPDAVSVHDIAGMKLMEDREGRVLNIYSLPRGIYFVHIRSGNRVEKIRFEKL